MKVELQKSFAVPGSAEVAWGFLQNIEAVAACMPGAKITERIGEGRFKGTVSVKMGPATMSFRGEVEVRDVDPAGRSLSLLGKGTDSTGTSGASMDLRARIEPGGDDRCSLVSTSEVSMSGKAAAFGGRMLNSVADQILKQFADNFAAQVAALAAQRVAATGAASSPPNAAHAVSEGSGAMAAAVPPPVAPPLLPPKATELNALALVWAVFKNWMRGLFSRKSA